MAFHSLSTDSGGTDEDRRKEATRIVIMFQDFDAIPKLNAKERKFMDDMAQGFPVTVPQLFYMRELKTKYID